MDKEETEEFFAIVKEFNEEWYPDWSGNTMSYENPQSYYFTMTDLGFSIND